MRLRGGRCWVCPLGPGWFVRSDFHQGRVVVTTQGWVLGSWVPPPVREREREGHVGPTFGERPLQDLETEGSLSS